MSRARNLTTTTLLCGALAVSLVASACKSKTDRDDAAVRSDTSTTYGGTTPTDTLSDTARRGDTSRSVSGTTATRRTGRSTSQRRMTDQERQLYQQGQWDSSKVGQQIPVLPRPDTVRPDTMSLEQRAYPAVTPTDEPQDTTLPNVPPQQQPQQPADVAVRGDTAKPAENVVTPAAADEPSDGQIVQLTLSANATDSTAGALASTRATNAQVRDFARMMVQDHGAANQRVMELVRRLNLRPDSAWEDNRDLLETSREAARELMTKSGHEFDHGFIDNEVDAHQRVLEALDRKLIPEADNAELKTLLQEARQTVQRHLERARELQNTLRR
jgi:putative membrane protein